LFMPANISIRISQLRSTTLLVTFHGSQDQATCDESNSPQFPVYLGTQVKQPWGHRSIFKTVTGATERQREAKAVSS
jgi:hypothetical protein